MILCLKKTHHKKRAGSMAQGVGPGVEFKPQYHQKKKFKVELTSAKVKFCPNH
jgi:hypothetical protein